MTESPKFGSMLHLPWSEEAPRTRTNKVLDRVDLNTNITLPLTVTAYLDENADEIIQKGLRQK